ncbi:hypothetical protein FJY71_09370, partial [candidate division WOR-3 bacterium]|nr:hypothetical protein [candidate division WOR-3 bacterium]
VVAADGTGGSQCGVAPDAQVMALRVRTTADSISEMQCWQAMEFAVSPPLAERAGANAYVMPLGWLLSWQPHQAAWRQAVVNTNAAGLVQVAPSGSERGTPPPNACRCPGHVPPPWWNPDNTGVGALAGMVTTGGVDSSDVIASMSSPGPVTWMNVPPYSDFAHPPGLTKPEVVAPAINIKSLGLGGGYTVMSGTSWATAFVGAVAALMLSKDSTLLPADVDSILELTAVDLGPARKDNDYGAGRIDAYAAVNYIGTAVAEGRSPSAARHRASIVSRADLRLPPGALLLDAAGRPAAEASGLAPGVYFVRERPRSGSSRITGMVVIAR